MKHLSSIAVTQPHAAYAAFTHGLASRWTYLSRTIPNIEDMMKPLETTIRQHFLPSLTGQNPFNDQYRDLLALPARLGGLGITNPSKQTTSQFDASMKITAALAALITQQSHSYPPEAKAKQAKAKRNTHTLHRQQDETAVVYKRLASLIADKHSKLCSRTLHWLRCRINFSLLRSAIMCLRGSRSAAYRPASPTLTGDNVDLASSEGRVPNQDQIEYSLHPNTHSPPVPFTYNYVFAFLSAFV